MQGAFMGLQSPALIQGGEKKRSLEKSADAWTECENEKTLFIMRRNGGDKTSRKSKLMKQGGDIGKYLSVLIIRFKNKGRE